MLNSLKIFKYELRRIAFSKSTVLFGIITLLYSYYLLKSVVIAGYYGTAPFSEWTFIDYMLNLCPIIAIIPLVLCSRLFSAKEKSVQCLFASTPMSEMRYLLIKLAAIVLVSMLLVSSSIGACFWFYATKFNYLNFESFIPPILMFLIAPMIFFFELGLWLGSKKLGYMYALIIAVFLAYLFRLSLPISIDILGFSFQSLAKDKELIKGVIEFSLPSRFVYGHVGFMLTGFIFLLSKCTRVSGSQNPRSQMLT